MEDGLPHKLKNGIHSNVKFLCILKEHEDLIISQNIEFTSVALLTDYTITDIKRINA